MWTGQIKIIFRSSLNQTHDMNKLLKETSRNDSIFLMMKSSFTQDVTQFGEKAS